MTTAGIQGERAAPRARRVCGALAALALAAAGCARRGADGPPMAVPGAGEPPASGRAVAPPALQIERASAWSCELIPSGYGPAGEVPVRATPVVSGLEVPWSLAFVPGGDLLVTERPGRLRLVRGGQLVREPVAKLPVLAEGEGGLLGLALHPNFGSNHFIYLYATVRGANGRINRVERWRLAPDARSAQRDRVIVDDLPAAEFHDGGRLRFGPDGMLYVTIGDTTEPATSQDRSRLSGKMLRLTPEGAVPTDNPFPGSPVFLYGLRNTEAYDWVTPRLLYLADHGPSGEFGLHGHDELDVARAGDNLGWPIAIGCTPHDGVVSPLMVWAKAMPPGGAAVYRGRGIPQWTGSLLVGVLGARQLHRFVFDPEVPPRLVSHEVYFEGDPPKGLGRLRDVVNGPDGYPYVTTSNCDGRGKCPALKDQILRIEPR